MSRSPSPSKEEDDEEEDEVTGAESVTPTIEEAVLPTATATAAMEDDDGSQKDDENENKAADIRESIVVMELPITTTSYNDSDDDDVVAIISNKYNNNKEEEEEGSKKKMKQQVSSSGCSNKSQNRVVTTCPRVANPNVHQSSRKRIMMNENNKSQGQQQQQHGPSRPTNGKVVAGRVGGAGETARRKSGKSSSTVPPGNGSNPNNNKKKKSTSSIIMAKQQAIYFQSILPSSDNDDDDDDDENGCCDDDDDHNDTDNVVARVGEMDHHHRHYHDSSVDSNNDDNNNEISTTYPGAVAVHGMNTSCTTREGRESDSSFLYDATNTIDVLGESGTTMTGGHHHLNPIQQQTIPSLVTDTYATTTTTSPVKQQQDVLAIVVDRDELEQELRNQIHNESIRAVQVSTVDDNGLHRSRLCFAAIIIGLLLVVIVGLIIGFTVGLNRRDDATAKLDESSTTTFAAGGTIPGLQSVIAKDVVTCGISHKDQFGYINETTGTPEGFEADLCRAMAAMVLDDPDKIKTKFLTGLTRFKALANGTVDILTYTATHTMSRDVNERRTNEGFTFTVPYLYDGIQFGGYPDYVQCADDCNFYGNCSNLSICVSSGTTDFDILSSQFPIANLQLTETARVLEAFVLGECNVLSGESYKISKILLRQAGYKGPYSLGRDQFTKEPLSMVTRQDDPEWAHHANTIIQALLAGEKMGLTQKDAMSLMLDASSSSSSSSRTTEDHENSFDARVVRIVAAVGNYEEMYQRHLDNITPRTGQNLLNDGTSGLIFSHPFANVGTSVSSPVAGGSINRILQRGYLVCGIHSGHPGFATTSTVGSGGQEWTGLDVDYCRAVASALFGSFSRTLELVQLSDNFSFQDNNDNDEIDVVAGALQEYHLGIHNSFSQPYYYYEPKNNNSNNGGGARTLMTSSRDPQWSDFVYWIVSATFYAEEQHIQRSNANLMPEVYLFGPELVRMFRDAILQVGNYGEMYFRNLQDLEPRNGRNMLNSNPYTPQHYVLY